MVHSYRILYIGPKHKFDINRLFDLDVYEVLLMVSFLVIILFKLLAYSVLGGSNRSGRRRGRLELVYRTFSGCFGQEQYKRPNWISTTVTISLFFFFVYINYVLKSATLISELSTDPSRRFKSLDTVNQSDVPLFITLLDFQYDEHLLAKIE